MNWEWHKELTGCIIYADGACEPNPGEGGWGFVAYLDGFEIHDDCGGRADTTNNVMELTGVIKALEWIANTDLPFATLYCDSQYVVKGCNEWRHKWKKHGWRKSKNGPFVKNVDLWRDLDALLSKAPAKIEWVKGHVGILGNERADDLSNLGREMAIEHNSLQLSPSKAVANAGAAPSQTAPAPLHPEPGSPRQRQGSHPPVLVSNPAPATIPPHNTSAWSAS